MPDESRPDAPDGAWRAGWRARIPAEDWARYGAAGYGRSGMAGSRPALLVVDSTNRFVGVGSSLAESLAVYPGSAGPPAWGAVERAKVLLDACRARGHPVAFTVRDERREVQASQLRRDKHADAPDEPADANEVVAALTPLPGEAVIPKSKPSPFHGTPLLSLLVYRRVDTVVVAGGVTSGCVRASAVDAFSLGFRVVVAEDAVFDRSELSHAVNLFDLCQKYAEVTASGEVARYLLAVRGDGWTTSQAP